MNSLLVANPEIRKEVWYKQENVTNISMFQMLILKLLWISPKISWKDTWKELDYFTLLDWVQIHISFCTKSSHIMIVKSQKKRGITDGKL